MFNNVVSIRKLHTLPNEIYIKLIVTNSCNYNCKYCHSHLNEDDSIFFDDYRYILDFINNISKIYKDNNFKIQLFGGEPTLCSYLSDITRYLDNIENVKDIILYTNLSKDNNYYIDLSDISDKLTLYASFHPRYIQFKDFIKNIQDILPFFNRTMIFVMWDPSVLDLIQIKFIDKYLTALKSKYNNIAYELSKIVGNDQQMIRRYNDKEEEWFKNKVNTNMSSKDYELTYKDNSTLHVNSEFMRCNNIKGFEGYICNAMKTHFYLNNDGNIYPCKSYHYYRFEPVFNIYTDDISKFQDIFGTPIKCSCKKCVGMYNIDKVYPSYYNDEYNIFNNTIGEVDYEWEE